MIGQTEELSLQIIYFFVNLYKLKLLPDEDHSFIYKQYIQ